MRAKEFFLSVRDAEHKVKSLRQRQRKYKEMACSISGMSETNIRSVGSRSRTETAALRLVDVEEQIADEAEHYVALIEQAEAVIRQISKPRYRQVLELRYLCGLSWRTVSDEMGYRDAKSAFRVHGWALAAAQKILDKTELLQQMM